eukprot:12550-Heterococcus_DN1.PRE.2
MFRTQNHIHFCDAIPSQEALAMMSAPDVSLLVVLLLRLQLLKAVAKSCDYRLVLSCCVL